MAALMPAKASPSSRCLPVMSDRLRVRATVGGDNASLSPPPPPPTTALALAASSSDGACSCDSLGFAQKSMSCECWHHRPPVPTNKHTARTYADSARDRVERLSCMPAPAKVLFFDLLLVLTTLLLRGTPRMRAMPLARGAPPAPERRRRSRLAGCSCKYVNQSCVTSGVSAE